MSEDEFKELPPFQPICGKRSNIGNLAREYDQRLGFHPGPFNVPATAIPDIMQKAIKNYEEKLKDKAKRL